MEERTSVVNSEDDDDVISEIDFDDTFEPDELPASFIEDANADDSARLMTETERRKRKVSGAT